MEYAVIFNYSFDDEVVVILFEDEEAAKQFLKDSYDKELRIDREENEWDSVGEISEDCRYAKITTRFYDHDDVTEFRVGRIFNGLS